MEYRLTQSRETGPANLHEADVALNRGAKGWQELRACANPVYGAFDGRGLIPGDHRGCMRTRVMFRLFTCFCAAVLIAACAGPRNPRVAPNRPPPPITEIEQDIKLMLSYDENSDGTVTRQELEDGLHRQFAAADLDHDGRIDLKEMQAENDRRFRAFGTEASPLIDWNQDGYIDFDEFASTPRSVFEEMDKNHDAKLDGNELRLPNAPRPAQPRPVPRQGQGGGR